MSLELPPLSAKIVGDISSLKDAFAKGVAEGQKFGRDLDNAIKQGGFGGSGPASLDAMRAQFSVQRQAIEQLKQLQASPAATSFGVGAGALAIGYAAAQVIDRLSIAAEKYSLAVEKDADAWKDVVHEQLASLPIVGQLGQAGERIWNLVSGETAYVNAIKQATEEQEHHIKTVNDVHAALARASAESANFRVHLGDDIRSLNLAPGLESDLSKITVAFRKAQEEAASIRGSSLADPRLKTLDADLTAARQRVIDLQTEINNANPATTAMMEDPEFREGVKARGGAPGGLSDLKTAQDHVKELENLKKQKDQIDRDFGANLGVAAQRGFTQLKDLFTIPDGSDGPAAKIDNLREAVEHAQREVDQFNMTAGQRMFDDFKRTGGAGEALDTMRQLADQFDALNKAKDDEAQRERAEAQWRRGLDKLKLGPEGDTGSANRAAPFLREGGVEAFRLITGSQQDNKTERQLDKLIDIMDDQRDVMKEMNDKLAFQVVDIS